MTNVQRAVGLDVAKDWVDVALAPATEAPWRAATTEAGLSGALCGVGEVAAAGGGDRSVGWL